MKNNDKTPQKKEINIQNSILLHLSQEIPDMILFRNHTGKVKDQRGVYHTFGLSVGSADIVGCYKGRFVGIEVKTAKGRLQKIQENWIARMREVGAFIIVARSPEDAIEQLQPLLNKQEG